MALNILWLDAKLGKIWGFSSPFFTGHSQEICIAVLPLGLKPHHVEKLWTSKNVSWQRKEETCTIHKIAFAERAI